MATKTTPRMMTATVQRRYGDDPSEVLATGQVPVPAIGARDVLVEVRAAAVDRGTWHLMVGRPYAARLAFGVRRPRNPVPGRDLAGVVVAVGEAVTRFAPGDEVYGTGAGSYAEYTSANESRLAPKPANLTFEQAAAVPVSGLTALQGLCDVGRLEPGQDVLVIGASGGVGSYAVQIAVARGARVTAVCSAAKADAVRALGAHEVLDHATDGVAPSGRGHDLVLDIAGDTPLAQLRASLAPDGTLVVVGGEVGRWIGIGRQLRAVALSPFVGQRLTMLVSRERHEVLERLTELVEEGSITPVVDRTYPLEETAAAMARLIAGSVTGKLVIVP